jgi:hypothetical protein
VYCVPRTKDRARVLASRVAGWRCGGGQPAVGTARVADTNMEQRRSATTLVNNKKKQQTSRSDGQQSADVSPHPPEKIAVLVVTDA